MLTIGLTGPSGAGKGEAASIIEKHGFSIIDADAVYHGLLIPPSECFDELVSVFGSGILSSDGLIDRASLASLVFGEKNKDKLELLNKITHKYVLSEIRKSICTLNVSGCKGCVIDAPLLIESGLCDDCDLVISIIADKDIRSKRISQRDGITPERARLRIDSQKDDSFYIENSDFTVENCGDTNALAEKIEKILLLRGY